MADLREGNHSLIFGGFMDFHAGCMGSEMIFADGSTIDFFEEWNERVRRPWTVAEMVAKKIGADVVTKYRKTPFNS